MNERPFDCGEQGRRDRLLYWIDHLPYFACSPYLSNHFQGKSLRHSGVYIISVFQQSRISEIKPKRAGELCFFSSSPARFLSFQKGYFSLAPSWKAWPTTSPSLR